MKHYRTAHQSRDCICKSVTVPYDELIEVIRKGGVPLISIERNENSEHGIELRVQKRSFFTKYAAISHVWVDGLGNPGCNVLPTCRLIEIAARLHDINGKPNSLFWLDTLCIPAKAEHSKLRTRCIDEMASIYAGADTVLVLDHALMRTRPKSLDACLARIMCSVWMCRSWTLQEGILARTCAFQFQGAILFAKHNDETDTVDWHFSDTLHESTSLLYNENPYPVDHEIERQLDRAFWAQYKQTAKDAAQRSLTRFFAEDFFGVRRLDRPRYEQFIFVWNALAGRSTTQPEDLLRILANLLGFRCAELMGLRPEDRLPTLILSMGAIPFSLFFNNCTTPRQSVLHANNWMPTHINRSILDLHPLLIIRDSKLSFADGTRHLQKHLDIFLVHQIIPSNLETIELRVTNKNTVYRFTCPHTENDSEESSNVFDTTNFQGTCFIILKSTGKGAIFYFDDQINSGQGNELLLYFMSSADVKKYDTSQLSTFGDEVEFLTGKELEAIFHPSISIHYAHPPAFRPIPYLVEASKPFASIWIASILCGTITWAFGFYELMKRNQNSDIVVAFVVWLFLCIFPLTMSFRVLIGASVEAIWDWKRVEELRVSRSFV